MRISIFSCHQVCTLFHIISLVNKYPHRTNTLPCCHISLALYDLYYGNYNYRNICNKNEQQQSHRHSHIQIHKTHFTSFYLLTLKSEKKIVCLLTDLSWFGLFFYHYMEAYKQAAHYSLVSLFLKIAPWSPVSPYNEQIKNIRLLREMLAL